MKTIRIGCVAIIALIPAFTSGETSLPSQVEGHRSGLMARVISADGTSRTVRLEGVGCSESMCSRVFLRGNSQSGAPSQTWLDSIVSIKAATGNDAWFAMRDGTERRLTFLPSFRVLYVSTPSGRREKLDLAKIRSLEFIDPGK